MENTGNIGDDYSCSYVGTGFDVTFTPESQFIDFGTNGNTATFVATITVLEDAPAGNSSVPVQIRSESSSAARATVNLIILVSAVYDSELVSTESGGDVSGDTVRTIVTLANSGNIDSEYALALVNLDTLNALGWSAEIVSLEGSDDPESLSIDFRGEAQFAIEFTSIRADPDPSAEATVTITCANDTGRVTIASVPIFLPDMDIGTDGLEAERSDVTDVYDASDLYLNIGLVSTIGVLVAAFILLRRRKGLGGKRKRGETR